MSNLLRLDQRHRCRMTGVKEVANPFELDAMNVVCNNNKRKLTKQESNKTEKKKRKKIRRTGGCENISNGASLPEDIIMDILPMLPVKSIARFRCVCKSWCNLFKTTNFAKLQLDNSLKNCSNEGIIIDSAESIWMRQRNDFAEKICYLDYDSLSLDSSALYNKLVHLAYPVEYKIREIVGSCNGLVCYRSSDVEHFDSNEDIIIWNPFTKEYKKISSPPESRGYKLFYGFGYDSNIEDYKLVMYLVKGYFHRNIHIYVYSLKSNLWRTVKNTPNERPSKNPVFFKGYFHWVDDLRPGPKKLSCFDTVNGTVKHILLPQHFQHKFKVVQACLLGDRLCVTAKVKQNIREVWTMKDYGVAESWTIMYSNHKIPQNLSTSKKNKMNYLRLQRLEYFRQCFKNAAVLVYPDDNATYLYDLNHEEFRELKIDGISPSCKTWAFFGSLVSPNLGSCSRVQ